jgi:hypothetical protein
MKRLFALILMVPGAALADDGDIPNEGRAAFTIQFENDIFFDTDQHYTSGVGFNYTTAPQETPDLARDVTTALPFLFDDRNAEIRANYEIAQDIFTPRRTGLVVPDPNDRPYAGYLYAGFSVLSRTDTNLDQLELQAGVIGPASLAEDAQNWVHTVIGDHKALGWHYQLRDEPGLELTYQRAVKIIPPQSLFGVFFDIEPHYGAAVGNVYDYVNVGAMARVGINLPDDFGPPRLEPSLPGSNFYEPNGFSAYVFGGVDGRAVGRNIFLDGNSFQDSASVVKKPFVGDLQIGAAIALDFARLSFTHVFRTKEFKTQQSADQFGSVNLTFLL